MDKTGLPPADREAGVTTVDSREFQDMIRGGRVDPGDEGSIVEQIIEDTDKAAGRDEIRMEGDEEPKAPSRPSAGEARSSATPQDDDSPIAKALRSIEQQNQQLRAQLDELRVAQRTRDETASALGELVEIMPGVRLPKDESKWPLHLTEKHVEALGLDPSATRGLHVLGNALLWQVAQIYGPIWERMLESRLAALTPQDREPEIFFESYGDLRDVPELVETVEARVQREIQQTGTRFGSRKEYMDHIASETRKRLAAIRGVSYEDYVASVGGRARPAGVVRSTARSRAITPGSSRPGRSSSTGGYDPEMADMFKG